MRWVLSRLKKLQRVRVGGLPPLEYFNPENHVAET